MSKELTTQRLTLVPVCETDTEVILPLASDRESISDFHPVFTGSEDLRSWIRALFLFIVCMQANCQVGAAKSDYCC